MKKKFLLLIIVNLTLAFVILLSTIIVTNSKFIYYKVMEGYHLNEVSDISTSEVNANYSYVVDYILSKDNNDKFQLPTLKYSKDGAFHFYEVRKLFALAQNATSVLFIAITLLLYVYYRCFKDVLPLKYIGKALIYIPMMVSIIVSINFTFFFTVFHKIFFNNDKWLFDPIQDPIINFLPEEYFALCAGLIVILTMISGIIFLLLNNIFSIIIKKKSNNNISVNL